MDESESSDSCDETNNDSVGRNESDNKLAQYMLINKVIDRWMEVTKTFCILLGVLVISMKISIFRTSGA